MRRRTSTAPPLFMTAVVLLGPLFGCGKRADPLAPYVKTPAPPGVLEISQVGEEIEIRVQAPRTTTENRPLPVITLEWLAAPPIGDLEKTSTSLFREDVAPGELRAKRFPRSIAEVRYTVRAFDGKAKSALAPATLVKPTPAPAPPTDVVAVNTAAGVELRWTNPPGAEPWPPPPTPTPKAALVPDLANLPGAPPAVSASPGAPPASSPLPTAAPAPEPTVAPTPTPAPAPTPAAASPAVVPAPGAAVPPGTASPTPFATPAPTPPTGIRIFRTDGLPRIAREPLQASAWLDITALPGTTPCYALRYVASFKPMVESPQTEPVCVEVKDVVPPDPPARLLGDIGATFVELSWLASTSPDVAFYRLYRTIGAAPRALVVQTEGLLLRVRDNNIVSGPRTYDIVAVDKGGNESKPGPLLRVVVP